MAATKTRKAPIKEVSRDDIKAGNELLATVFLNWFQDPEDDRKESWLVIDEVAKYVVYSTYKDPFGELPFHKDWNYLDKVLEVVRNAGGSSLSDKCKFNEVLIDRFEIGRGSFFLSVDMWSKNCWVHDSFYHAYRKQEPELCDCDSYIVMIWKTMVDLARFLKTNDAKLFSPPQRKK